MNVSLKISNGIRNVYWPIVAIIIVQRYMSPEAFFLLNAAWVLYIIFTRRTFITRPIWGFPILLVFVVWGTFMALPSIFDMPMRDYIRDLFYYINPVVFILSGAYFFKIGVDRATYFNSLILGNFVHVLIFIFNFFTGREYGGVSGYLWVPLALLLINRFDEERTFSKVTRIIMIILYMVPFAISFSRVSIIFLACIYILGISDRLNVIGFLRVVLIFTVLIIVGNFFFTNLLPADKQEMYNEKIDKSFNEISPNQDWNDPMTVTDNWRGYELHCSLVKFTNASPLQQLFGFGFGEQIYVGKYAYNLLEIRDQEGHQSINIAVTHNGYANVLIKLGVIGVLLLLFFYFQLLFKSLRFAKKYNMWEGRMLAGIVLGLVLMTYILNGLYKDVCYYSMVTSIGYLGYQFKYYKKDDEEEKENITKEFKDNKEIAKKGFENVR